MAKIRLTPGTESYFRRCADGEWREITPQWQEFDDALITEGMRMRPDIEIEDSAPIAEDTLDPTETEETNPAAVPEPTVKATRKRGRK